LTGIKDNYWHAAHSAVITSTGPTITQAVFVGRGLTKKLLHRRNRGKFPARRAIDLYAGEIAVLFGVSGSGKSTPLNILGGLNRAMAGKVRFGDNDLMQASERQRTQHCREHANFVFPFYNLIASLTTRESLIQEGTD
jgi:putative ABC transport system ATP-binding protein